MTCKDCLHCDICDCIGIGFPCADFQDKSEWVHLPCKVGDTAYLVHRYRYPGLHDWRMKEIIIGAVDIEHSTDGNECYIEADGGFYGGYLGATAFLTKAEAEKALEERKTTHYDA